MNRQLFVCALILSALSLLVGCPGPGDGEGGMGGSIPGTGGHDAGPCAPLHDNDPIACSPNKCTTTSDGCGGHIRCDTICNTMNTPASCGFAEGGTAPMCIPCTRTPPYDGLCESTPDRPWAWRCDQQYPQPGQCIPKNLTDGIYTACCGVGP